MKKFNLIFVVMLLLLAVNAFAQAPDILWAQSYGTGDHDECWEVQQTSDGGYIMVGSSYTDDTALYDVYLVRADEFGNHLWTQVFGIGMFVFGMGCILVGAVIAFFIIKEVTKERKKPTRFDDLE